MGVYPLSDEPEYPEFEYDGEFNEKPLLDNNADLSPASSHIDEEARAEVGIDLANWKYAIMTPEMRTEIAKNGIGLLSRWVDFWGVLNTTKGIDDPSIIKALDESVPIKVIGPRASLISHANTYMGKAEDALYYLWQLAQSEDAQGYRDELSRGHIPKELKSALEQLVADLIQTPSVHESIELREALLQKYQSAILQFRSKSSLYAFRTANPDDAHPTNLIYGPRAKMAPWEAAVAAELDDSLRYTLNLNEVKNGVKSDISKSFPNAPTKQVVYNWQNIIKHLVDYTDVIVVNADMTQCIPETKGLNFGVMIDEFTQIVRGKPTHLGKMLNDLKALNYTGLLLIETPSPVSQTRRLGDEINKAVYIIHFIKNHFDVELSRKRKEAKNVR